MGVRCMLLRVGVECGLRVDAYSVPDMRNFRLITTLWHTFTTLDGSTLHRIPLVLIY
jgi:hypothetical protein